MAQAGAAWRDSAQAFWRREASPAHPRSPSSSPQPRCIGTISAPAGASWSNTSSRSRSVAGRIPPALRRRHGLASEQIRSVRIATFHHATRLSHPQPATTEEAQYSLPFPVAVALKYGAVRFDALTGEAVEDAEVLRLSHAIRAEERAEFSARFPEQRVADVRIELFDGRHFDSGPTQASGDPDLPPAASAIRQKFWRFAEGVHSKPQELANRVERLGADDPPIAPLLDLVLGELQRHRSSHPGMT